jgi:hypothetical protein
MAFALRGLKQDKFLPFSICADNSLHHLDKIGMANFHRRVKRANNLSLSETWGWINGWASWAAAQAANI